MKSELTAIQQNEIVLKDNVRLLKQYVDQVDKGSDSTLLDKIVLDCLNETSEIEIKQEEGEIKQEEAEEGEDPSEDEGLFKEMHYLSQRTKRVEQQLR